MEDNLEDKEFGDEEISDDEDLFWGEEDTEEI